MSDPKYAGEIGPSNAMSALDPAFNVAYLEASGAIMKAVQGFERATGRVVDEIALKQLDVTKLHSPCREFLRNASLHFLPTEREVDW